MRERETGFYYVTYEGTTMEDIVFWDDDACRWDICDEFYEDMIDCMKILGKVPSFKQWSKYKWMIN